MCGGPAILFPVWQSDYNQVQGRVISFKNYRLPPGRAIFGDTRPLIGSPFFQFSFRHIILCAEVRDLRKFGEGTTHSEYPIFPS